MRIKKNYIPVLMGLFLMLPTLFLINANVGRGLFVITSIFLWIVVSLHTEKYILTSILYIIFVLPFNITFQLPLTVELFKTIVLNIQPFVNGIYSSYLVPTISILDVGILLLLFSIVYEKTFKYVFKVFKQFKKPLLGIVIVLLISNIYHWDFLTLFTSLRIYSLIISLILVSNWLKKYKRKNFWKYIVITLIISVLFQGIIGILQFDGGSSLELNFLGESQVVNGMQGSSFVSLNDGIYLRAYGTFPHPNILGGYLLMSFTLFWISIKYVEKKTSILSYIGMFICIVFSLFTFSRISILLMFIGSLLFVISKIEFKEFKNKMFSFNFLLISERFMNLLTGGDTSWSDRKNLIVSSFEIIKDNFFFGSGLGNYVKYMEGNVPRTGNGILLIQPVHNVLLLSFSELGFFGFISFAFLLVEYFKRFVNFKKELFVKVFILSILLLVGSFDHFLFSLPQGLVISNLLLICLIL